MKPIYKSLALAAMTLSVSLSLQAQVNDGESVTESAVLASSLDGLKVELVSPNVTGARDLIASGECVIDGADLTISLNAGKWIKGATYSVRVSAVFGTQTVVLYVLNVSVPYYVALSNTPQEYEDEITVVSTFGDGDKSGADASVYSKDGDGNAQITKPLSVNGGVQEGNPYGEVFEINVVVLTPEQKAEVEVATGTAYDYCDTNDEIPDGLNVTIYADEECTQKVGSTAKTQYVDAGVSIEGDYFNLQNGESISAGTYYARTERGIMGDYSHAEGNSTTASGMNSHAEGKNTTAIRNNSHAEGESTRASGGNSHAEGDSTIASGVNSHTEGYSTIASGDNSHAEGYSTIAGGGNSHAEGESTRASGGNSHAEGIGTTASNYAAHAEGNGTIARGNSSHAEGRGTIASQEYQHVCGQFNVEDTDNSYQFIVGNGADGEHRHNAFAVTKSGELALFKADGTPAILTASDLEALIGLLGNN